MVCQELFDVSYKINNTRNIVEFRATSLAAILSIGDSLAHLRPSGCEHLNFQPATSTFVLIISKFIHILYCDFEAKSIIILRLAQNFYNLFD